VIEANEVIKSFGPMVALRGVSFSAPDGAITGILGPNGAGKTTLLRILSTVLRPDQGRVFVDGIDVLLEPEEVQRRIGVLPHAHGLYARLSAREHIRYYGELHGMEQPRLEARIEELIRLLGMEDLGERRTKGFSEGQRVKVAIARALVHDPKNILLDEPTAGLDVMSTRSMRGVLRRLRDEGRCVLFSSHIMQEVAQLCDRIVILSRGLVIESGSPNELLEKTGCTSLEDAFVAVTGAEGLA
jgi:sodium transport system ATP-binding protein